MAALRAGARAFPACVGTFPAHAATLPARVGVFPACVLVAPASCGSFPSVRGSFPSARWSLPGGRGSFPSAPWESAGRRVASPKVSFRGRPLTTRSSEQRLAAGLFCIRACFRQPLSLSLDSLGQQFPRSGSSMASVFPFAVAGGSSAPSSCQPTLRPAQAVLLARLSFPASQSLRSALPGGSARHSPAGGSSPVPAVQRPSLGGRPNHALQRTEAGVPVFSVYHASPRQPLSLSLSSLGDAARLP